MPLSAWDGFGLVSTSVSVEVVRFVPLSAMLAGTKLLAMVGG